MSIRTNHEPATGRSRITRAIRSGFAAIALTSTITALGAIVGAAARPRPRPGRPHPRSPG